MTPPPTPEEFDIVKVVESLAAARSLTVAALLAELAIKPVTYYKWRNHSHQPPESLRLTLSRLLAAESRRVEGVKAPSALTPLRKEDSPVSAIRMAAIQSLPSVQAPEDLMYLVFPLDTYLECQAVLEKLGGRFLGVIPGRQPRRFPQRRFGYPPP